MADEMTMIDDSGLGRLLQRPRPRRPAHRRRTDHPTRRDRASRQAQRPDRRRLVGAGRTRRPDHRRPARPLRVPARPRATTIDLTTRLGTRSKTRPTPRSGTSGGRVSGTPLYYRPFLERFPQRIASALAAIAEADPAASWCIARPAATGPAMVTLVLLALLGVPPEAIVADYVLSADGLRRRSAHHGGPDEDIAAQALLQQAGTTAAAELASVLATLDPVAYLRAGGLHDAHLDALRARLVAAVPSADAL